MTDRGCILLLLSIITHSARSGYDLQQIKADPLKREKGGNDSVWEGRQEERKHRGKENDNLLVQYSVLCC